MTAPGCLPTLSPSGTARAEALMLGRRGSPFDFLPRALALLGSDTGKTLDSSGPLGVPADHELRLLVASAFLRLGLRTAAQEHVALLPPSTPRRSELVAAILALPDERLTHPALEAKIEASLAALDSRGVDVSSLRGALPVWRARVAEEAWFRCVDGNVVRRRAGPTEAGGTEWIRLADERRAARGPLPAVGGGGGSGPVAKPPPVYVEGFDPPWLVERLLAERPIQADGYVPRVVVVQEDPAEFLSGMALAEAGVWSHPGLEVIVGPGVAEALATRLATRLDLNLGEICLEVPSTVTRVAGLRQILGRATAEQLARTRRDVAMAAQRSAGRDRAWWAARYAQPGFRPRVLIPTTRYSTFIRHSSADIAAALRDTGCEVRVLEEPDASSCLTTAGYAHACATFDPDMVILINYTRRLGGAAIPSDVPFVCWVQDAMSHLFSRETGASMGPMDFLVGHLHWAFFETFGYPRARALGLPVLASRRKFSSPDTEPGPGRIEPRLVCDVACVTHHSETPEQFRARLLREAGGGGASGAGAGVVEHIYDALVRVAAEPLAQTLASRVKHAVEGALASAGCVVDAARVTGVAMSIAWPLLDRMMRHQTLHWAAEISRRRGWRLHLYGRGWSGHATLGEFDRGELAHGRDLRDAFRGAGAHLHVSPHTNLHQRVMECALSGGLPLCRLTLDWVCQLAGFAASNLAASGAPTGQVPGVPVPCAWTADHWSSMALVAQVQRLGLAEAGAAKFHVNEHALPGEPGARGARIPIIDPVRKEPWFYNAGMPIPADVAWLLGDLNESTFWDEATLESRLDRAINDRAWRADMTRGLAARVERELTYESAVERIIGLVREGLASA